MHRLLGYLAIASEAMPLLAVVALRRRVYGARAWVVAWCTLVFAWEVLVTWLGTHGRNNLWTVYLFQPASVALVLWTLSLWQAHELPRLTMRLAVPIFLSVWAVLTLAVEDTSAFSRAVDPLSNLVALGAAVYTLLSRSQSVEGSMARCDWLWVSGGIALSFGAGTALHPLGALLVDTSPRLVVTAFQVKSAVDIAAFLAIARGVTCKTEA